MSFHIGHVQDYDDANLAVISYYIDQLCYIAN